MYAIPLISQHLTASLISTEILQIATGFLLNTNLIDRILIEKLLPDILDHDQSIPNDMDDIENIIDSCIRRFNDPELNYIHNNLALRDSETPQIEIMLHRLSGQLRSWRKLV